MKLRDIGEGQTVDVPKFELPEETAEEEKAMEEETLEEKIETMDEKIEEKSEIVKEETDNTVPQVKDTEPMEEDVTDGFEEKEKTQEDHQFQTPNEPLVNTPKWNDSLFTPKTQGRRSRVSWMVEGSPWINSTKRSSKKARRSGVPADILGLFDDIPTDGSPLPTYLTPEANKLIGPDSPIFASVRKASISPAMTDDPTCSNLLAVLNHVSEHTDSPDINVWDEDSPVVASTRVGHDLPATTPLAPITNVIQPMTLNKDPEPANETITMDKDIGGQRKTRRSVMFASQDQENFGLPSAKHIHYPGTPIRADARRSMGMHSKVDINTEEDLPQGQNLMSFETPRLEQKTMATRKSSRISLLPGMEAPSPAVSLQDTNDLICWDTPATQKKRSRIPIKTPSMATPSLVTPSRRSRRISKVPEL